MQRAANTYPFPHPNNAQFILMQLGNSNSSWKLPIFIMQNITNLKRIFTAMISYRLDRNWRNGSVSDTYRMNRTPIIFRLTEIEKMMSQILTNLQVYSWHFNLWHLTNYSILKFVRFSGIENTNRVWRHSFATLFVPCLYLRQFLMWLNIPTKKFLMLSLEIRCKHIFIYLLPY